METDPDTTLINVVKTCNDHQLFRLTKFYRSRLEQTIEGVVDRVSSTLAIREFFTAEDHRKVIKLKEGGNRVDSSKVLLTLVMEKGSEARKVMWESLIDMRYALPKFYNILKDIQEHGPDSLDYWIAAKNLEQLPKSLEDVYQIHKETLRKKSERLRLNTILTDDAIQECQLLDRYTELTMVFSFRDRNLVEHELLARGQDHEKWRKECLLNIMEKIRPEELFFSSFSHNNSTSGCSAVVAGVPGIGKTTMVQKMVHDWATNKIYKCFRFVFIFKFRDLNAINCRITLKQLILDEYPYFVNNLDELWKNPECLLFIFDGLDEFKRKIGFTGGCTSLPACINTEEWCEVPDIVYSLIQHKLLPGCSVLVTTRPTALSLLEKANISIQAEILGFVSEERREYFCKFFNDPLVAENVFKYVKENEILYTLCYNPSYCWILGHSLGPFFIQKGRNAQQIPKTISQLYSYYIHNILRNHSREVQYPRLVMRKIGEMAYTGVSEKNIVFTSGDLIKYEIPPSQFLSGFVMELLEKDNSAQSVVYTFPHLTIQEFVAALTHYLKEDSGDVYTLLVKAHGTDDGRFEVFLRFVAGLSSPWSARPLEEFLEPFLSKTTHKVIDWIKETFEGELGPARSGGKKLLNMLHYLYEAQNTPLTRQVMNTVETLSFKGMHLNPVDCVVLSHILGNSEMIKDLDLGGCTVQSEGLQRLVPQLHRFHILRLDNNKLGDSGVNLLSDVLAKQDCKIQLLELKNNHLTASCAESLASALSMNCSLRYLYLGENQLRDAGVKTLAAILSHPNSAIQELELFSNRLGVSCVKDLATALEANQSLIALDVHSNSFEDSGVRTLSEVLRKPECNLKKIQLGDNDLTEISAGYLADVLSTNHSLTELNLSDNELGDSGVELLAKALGKPGNKMQRLWLDCVGLTAIGTKELASALCVNCSLTVLYLNQNELGDTGVEQLFEALSKPGWQLEMLGLTKAGLTDSCTEHLVTVLGTMDSLTTLTLGQNCFTDKSIPAIRHLIMNHKCLQRIGLGWNQFSQAGMEQLESMRGIRSFN
ncbi:NACHT, LRR and PYD domains-containing protein 3-like isoform X2 [Narcine bancroftii]|uniref:NACHT, LRR and PYD domains-containing protein 3-like isoform X2 n=1 Tax=Narcine bancroftii TaxID=1343680 RepID=UPI003832269E